MKILLLGAAGELAQILTQTLLDKTDADLVLYGRKVSSRLKVMDDAREKLVDGDFNDTEALAKAMDGVDVVFADDVSDEQATKSILYAMKSAGKNRLIAATSLGIYDEIPGKFGEWNNEQIGEYLPGSKAAAELIENSGLKYTLIRMAWLCNEKGNTKYELTQKGEPFKGTQVARQAVSQLIVDILNSKDDSFVVKSVGVSEPNTEGDKPLFYRD